MTNSLCFLPQVDQIIMLEGNTIAEMGTYEELKEKEGVFAEFIRVYLANNELNRQYMGRIFVYVQKFMSTSLCI